VRSQNALGPEPNPETTPTPTSYILRQGHATTIHSVQPILVVRRLRSQVMITAADLDGIRICVPTLRVIR
jgi:hypothetical protein